MSKADLTSTHLRKLMNTGTHTHTRKRGGNGGREGQGENYLGITREGSIKMEGVRQVTVFYFKFYKAQISNCILINLRF